MVVETMSLYPLYRDIIVIQMDFVSSENNEQGGSGVCS